LKTYLELIAVYVGWCVLTISSISCKTAVGFAFKNNELEEISQELSISSILLKGTRAKTVESLRFYVPIA
jgi:hypothetical protein